MKKINYLTTLVCMAILSSCGSSSSSDTASDPKVSGDNTSISIDGAGARFDDNTELQTGFKGFSVGNVYIEDGNHKKISGSSIALNSTFSIVFEDVKNYTLVGGKAFPSISINVSDSNQNMVISEADIMASFTDGLSKEDAAVLRATIKVADPMKPGQYIVSVIVIDKNNGEASILSTWTFDVK